MIDFFSSQRDHPSSDRISRKNLNKISTKSRPYDTECDKSVMKKKTVFLITARTQFAKKPAYSILGKESSILSYAHRVEIQKVSAHLLIKKKQ